MDAGDFAGLMGDLAMAMAIPDDRMWWEPKGDLVALHNLEDPSDLAAVLERLYALSTESLPERGPVGPGLDGLDNHLLLALVLHMDAPTRKQFRATSRCHRAAVDRVVTAARAPDGRWEPAHDARPFLAWPSLHTLNLRRLGRFDPAWLAGLPHLRHLSVAACGRLLRADCDALTAAPAWRGLQSLDVSLSLGDAALARLLAAPAPALERLLLRHVRGKRISPDADWASHRWPRLRHLNLSGQAMLKLDGVRAIAAAFPALQSLDISNCVEPEQLGEVLRTLAVALSDLRELTVKSERNNPSRPRYSVIDPEDEELHVVFPTLRRLCLRGHRLGRRDIQGLMFMEFPVLEGLDLSGSIRGDSSSSAALPYLTRDAPPTLKRLELDGWRLPSPNAYQQIARAFPALERLSLSTYARTRCSCVTDNTLVAIATVLPRLRELELSGKEGGEGGLTSDGVRTLLAQMRQLRVLRLLVDSEYSPLWPWLYKAAAGLREYSPHTRASCPSLHPDLCAVDRVPGHPHVFNCPPHAMNDFEKDTRIVICGEFEK